MKKIEIALIGLVVLLVLVLSGNNSSAQQFSSPLEYMNYISEQHQTINEDLWNYVKAASHRKNAGKVEAKEVLADKYSVRSTSQNIGSSIMPSGDNTVVINSTEVKPNSKIFVTPTSLTGKQTLVVTQKVEGQSFTVEMDRAINADIYFDWWILNVE